jgi:hypothetical protein
MQYSTGDVRCLCASPASPRAAVVRATTRARGRTARAAIWHTWSIYSYGQVQRAIRKNCPKTIPPSTTINSTTRSAASRLLASMWSWAVHAVLGLVWPVSRGNTA